MVSITAGSGSRDYNMELNSNLLAFNQVNTEIQDRADSVLFGFLGISKEFTKSLKNKRFQIMEKISESPVKLDKKNHSDLISVVKSERGKLKSKMANTSNEVKLLSYRSGVLKLFSIENALIAKS
jgi:hypothetical protein